MPDPVPNSLGARPAWLTFDCYGTLVQWHETLAAALARILGSRGASDRLGELTAAYRRREAELEIERPHRGFRDVTRTALLGALADLSLPGEAAGADALVEAISAIPPFPEVPGALARLKAAGFRTCIISNTDGDIIAGTLALLGAERIDRVVTAQEAGAYKPAAAIFEHAWSQLGVAKDDVFHVAAGVRVDLAAARDLGFRAAWVDRNTGDAPLPDYRPDLTVTTLDGLTDAFDLQGWMTSSV